MLLLLGWAGVLISLVTVVSSVWVFFWLRARVPRHSLGRVATPLPFGVVASFGTPVAPALAWWLFRREADPGTALLLASYSLVFNLWLVCAVAFVVALRLA